MIKTENGRTEFKGSRSEITADLGSIMQAALEETPIQFLIALEVFCGRLDAGSKDTVADRQRMLAAALSRLPKEELEALKKKAEED